MLLSNARGQLDRLVNFLFVDWINYLRLTCHLDLADKYLDVLVCVS